MVVDTREQAAELNAAIRERLVAAGRVDDTPGGHHRGGGADRRRGPDRHPPQRPRPGRGQPRHLDRHRRRPRRRAAWSPRPTPRPCGLSPGGCHPGRGRERVLPAGYVTAHVELGYATTAHGVQGDTVTAAHLVVGEHTGAASAYVGMTRGREANTAHLVAADVDEAREQWIAVFARDRADLGPAHAAQLAAAEAARYAPPRPLEQVLAELRAARGPPSSAACDRLDQLQPRARPAAAELVALEAPQPASCARPAGA